MTKDEEVAPVHVQDDLLVTKLKAETSQEKDPLDFETGRMIGILSAVIETSGKTERSDRAVVGPRLVMIGNVIEMSGVTERADAAAPGPKLAIESVTGSVAAIDGNRIETEIVIVIEAVIGSETATATEKETVIVIVIELTEIVKGTATEIETETGTVTGTVTAS